MKSGKRVYLMLGLILLKGCLIREIILFFGLMMSIMGLKWKKFYVFKGDWVEFLLMLLIGFSYLRWVVIYVYILVSGIEYEWMVYLEGGIYVLVGR